MVGGHPLSTIILMSQTFYIFRHGATFFSESDTPYGDQALTAQILPDAHIAIEKLAKYLADVPTDKNFRSAVSRCAQTTQIITAITGREFEVDQRLTEYYQETFDQLRERVASFIQEMEISGYRDIWICTHGAVMSAMKHLLLTKKYELADLMDYPKTGVLWIIKDGQVEEISFRD